MRIVATAVSSLLHFLIILLIYWRYRSTYERDNDTFRVWICLILSILLSFLVNHHITIEEVVMSFSRFTESLALLPQLFMIRRATRTPPPVVHFLMLMSTYKAVYLMSEAYHTYHTNDYVTLVPILLQNVVSVFGTIYSLYKVVDYDVAYEKVIDDTSTVWDANYHDSSLSGLKKYKAYAKRYYSYIDKIMTKQKSRLLKSVQSKKAPTKLLNGDIELMNEQTERLMDDSEDVIFENCTHRGDQNGDRVSEVDESDTNNMNSVLDVSPRNVTALSIHKSHGEPPVGAVTKPKRTVRFNLDNV